jgi:chorismate mutase
MQAYMVIPVFLGILILGTVAAHGDNDALQAMVETSAQRLELAKKVALAKWDSGANVEDPEREAQVIGNAAKEGQAKGLDPAQVSEFFQAQIEANKVIQYSLLSAWLVAGSAPPHAAVDLAKEIRPQLDQIQIQLIDQLAESSSDRASHACRLNVAHAVAAYLAAHRLNPDSRDAVAIERAMAATCTH